MENLKREEVLKEWREYLRGEKNLSVEEFNNLREKVVKVLEGDFEVVKNFLNELGVNYDGYIEVDGGDVYLVLKIGDVKIYYDGFIWEVYKNDNFIKSFKIFI